MANRSIDGSSSFPARPAGRSVLTRTGVRVAKGRGLERSCARVTWSYNVETAANALWPAHRSLLVEARTGSSISGTLQTASQVPTSHSNAFSRLFRNPSIFCHRLRILFQLFRISHSSRSVLMDALRSLTMVSDSSSCVRLSPAFSSSSSCASSCSPTLSCSSSLSSRSSCSLHPRANSPTSQPLSSFVPIERIDSSIHLHRPHHTHPLPSQYYPHHSDYSGASHTVSSTYPTNDSSILLHRTLNIDEFDRTLSEARDEPISCESPHPPAPHQPTPSFFSSPSCSSFYSFPADYHVDCARPAGHLYHRFDDDHRLDQQYHHHLHTHVLQRASKLGTFGSSSPRSSSRSSSRSHLYVKRTAANLRERRRMQSINEAFEVCARFDLFRPLARHVPRFSWAPVPLDFTRVTCSKCASGHVLPFCRFVQPLPHSPCIDYESTLFSSLSSFSTHSLILSLVLPFGRLLLAYKNKANRQKGSITYRLWVSMAFVLLHYQRDATGKQIL